MNGQKEKKETTVIKIHRIDIHRVHMAITVLYIGCIVCLDNRLTCNDDNTF